MGHSLRSVCQSVMEDRDSNGDEVSRQLCWAQGEGGTSK